MDSKHWTIEVMKLHYKKKVLCAEVYQTLGSLIRISSIENK